MGIVIINGKRYDSVTGLMIADTPVDDFAEVSQPETAPDWVSNCVNEAEVATNEVAADKSTTSAAEPAQSVDEAISSAVEKQPAKIERGEGVAHRRAASASRTLNRRFVKRPADELAKATENIAESAEVTVAVTTGNTSKSTQSFGDLFSYEDPDNVAAELDAATKQNSDYSEDVLNDRLEQLTKILQNASELDSVQNTSSAKRVATEPVAAAAKAEKKSAKQLKREAKLAKQEAKAEAKRLALAAKAERKEQKKRRFSAPAIFATASATAIIAAIAVYMVMPTVSVKVAANKAGIDVKSPYIPTGYSIDGSVAYSEGKVTINYKSASGSDGYSITQETSTADDATVRKQVSDKNGGYYQTRDVDGQSVYIYRDLITWVEDGIQYTINSNDYLNFDQIDSIIRSI